MKIHKYFLLTGILFCLLNGCTKEPVKKEITVKSDSSKQIKTTANKDFTGNYAGDGYEKRNDGFDWVAVIVKKISDDEISVSVRSRADQKKPTCLFDAKAGKVNDSTFESYVEEKRILYSFKDSVITISAAKPEDENVLYFYCSGGATIAGKYVKISGALDQSQIDKTIFSKVLNLQNVGFNITTKPKGDKSELQIYPFGLTAENQTVNMQIDGIVTDAEVEDLNSDGFPEVLVYTQSGENKAGNVLGCSVNNGKSMSFIYFPPVSENPEISKGYNGHDKFAVVETILSQRFPIYENGKETGKMRQIEYKLVNGENGRIFKVNNVTEFDLK